MNDWHYCPGCGTKLEHEVEDAEHRETEEQTEEVTDAAVKIAEIEAKRDVAVARISAGIAESEAVVEMAHAEGIAEGLETAVAPPEVPAAEPASPVVVVNDEQEEPESIPPAEHEHHEEPKAAPKKSGFF